MTTTLVKTPRFVSFDIYIYILEIRYRTTVFGICSNPAFLSSGFLWEFPIYDTESLMMCMRNGRNALLYCLSNLVDTLIHNQHAHILLGTMSKCI